MKRFNNNFWKLLKETVIRSLGHTDAAVVLKEVAVAQNRIVEKDGRWCVADVLGI